jgi:hypothetical protein
MSNERTSPNQALQRTAPAVTLAAPPPAPAQPSRQPPPSLSLRSLGVARAHYMNHIATSIRLMSVLLGAGGLFVSTGHSIPPAGHYRGTVTFTEASSVALLPVQRTEFIEADVSSDGRILIYPATFPISLSGVGPLPRYISSASGTIPHSGFLVLEVSGRHIAHALAKQSFAEFAALPTKHAAVITEASGTFTITHTDVPSDAQLPAIPTMTFRYVFSRQTATPNPYERCQVSERGNLFLWLHGGW